MKGAYRDPSGALAVIVSGMIAATPHQGGATWAILQYLIGLRALGCDVTFVEPIDGPLRHEQAAYCSMVMADAGLADRWALVGADGRSIAGLDDTQLARIARDADVLLNVSGMLAHERLLGCIDTRVYLDLDPGFIQMWHAFEGIDMRFDAHTHFVSIADTIGADTSPIPDCGRAWLSTLPPVVLDEWPIADALAHDALTTVAHWRGYGSIHRDGLVYGQKAH